MTVAHQSRSLAVGCLCALATTAVPGAQAPPGQAVPTQDGRLQRDLASQARTRIELGEAALKRGDHSEARAHFRSALPFGPAAEATLLGLLRASGIAGDADAQLLDAIRYCASIADERGRCRLDAERQALLPAGESLPLDLAAARAAAVAELTGLIARRPRGRAGTGFGVQARWATELGWLLMREAPALQKSFGAVFNTALSTEVADYRTVLQALRKVTTGAIRPQPRESGRAVTEQEVDAVILRAARCLTGMAAQAGFQDAPGPKAPDVGGLAGAAQQARARIRAKIESRAGAPLTLTQLQQMAKAEREAFTAEHASWANPGIAVSPTGKYLVQTTCGHDTLLGAVETIELHHARLVNWFGKDPFAGRQGLVRIVPAADGLESEDTPFWWAGGFQRGDLTTVQFNWSSIGALGRLLTHELTHRFDGRLHAFVPAWAVEGRAVWTGAAYGPAEDASFIAAHLQRRPCSTAFVNGYGGERKLQQLIEGKIADYRDNYTAGYALFVYLKASGGARPRFAARLGQYLGNARAGGKDPLKWFLHCFADGAEGRPGGLTEFAAGFREFIEGCYQWGWGRPPSWAAEFRTSTGKSRRVTPVLDEPTWIWHRDRAEPWFGQRHAAVAGRLLAELGQERPAIAALLWSLGTDDWQAAAALPLAGLLERQGHHEVAWTVRAELSRRGMVTTGDPLGPAPVLARLPKLRDLMRRWGQAVAALGKAGRPSAAGQIAAAHDAVARLVGAPTLGVAAVVVAAPLVPAPVVGAPVVPAPVVGASAGGGRGSGPAAGVHPVHLGQFGWTESGLTGFEQRREPGLWYPTGSGDLHVGRRKPRQDSGLLDRTAHQRHAFVRSAQRFGPDGYIFKTKVHFTTSYVAGAVVLGFSRRDRNVRLSFSAGDFLYSLGRKPEAAKIRQISFRIGGLWVREGNFKDAAPQQPHPFEQPTSSFALEVQVIGPTARVFIEGRHLFSYTTADLTPIMGSIGMAMSQGAVRLQNPTVQSIPLPPPGVEVDEPGQLLGRQLPGVPRHPDGTLVVWLPLDGGDDGAFDYPRWTTKALQRLRPMLEDKLYYPQGWVLMLPSTLSTPAQATLRKLAKENGLTVGLHQMNKPFTESVYGIYVDAWGGVRYTTDLLREGAGVPSYLERWARRSRARR